MYSSPQFLHRISTISSPITENSLCSSYDQSESSLCSTTFPNNNIFITNNNNASSLCRFKNDLLLNKNRFDYKNTNEMHDVVFNNNFNVDLYYNRIGLPIIEENFGEI